VNASVNKAIIIGNLGIDPEIKMTSTGSKLARFSVATNERWKDQDQNSVEKTEWHRIVIFGPKAEIAEKYLRKGSLVAIDGTIRNSKWTDKDGNERESVEIHITQGGGDFTMLGGRNDGGTGTEYPERSGPPLSEDDDIPF
jgi:single-strand DNA-binding protein